MPASLHLLRGEPLGTLSRKLRVTAVTLSHWCHQFLATGCTGLQNRQAAERDQKIRRLWPKAGEITIANKLLVRPRFDEPA